MNNDIKRHLEAAGIECIVLDRLDGWSDNYEITDDDGNVTDSVPQYWHVEGLAVAASDFDRAVAVIRDTMWEDLDVDDYKSNDLRKWSDYVGDSEIIPLDCVVTWHVNDEDRDPEHSIEGSGHYYIGYCA